MISFIIALIALFAGYFIYGRFIERIVKPTDDATPAISLSDGVDFVVLPSWKVFMIQFLNIAGTGPIFGAIMGAWYGPYAYLWIVFGCVFAGAVHDYLIGMMSVRNNGEGLPELVGKFMGKNARTFLLLFCLLVLMMVGVVFVYSPAIILANMAGDSLTWILIIFVYYILATLLPIDKIIARIYPLFAFSLIFMAVALMVVMFIKHPALPELWSDAATINLNSHGDWLGVEQFKQVNPIFPCMFITIACGAISGFHATQSPLMARCIASERLGRKVFYGSMITEGIVALVWATVSICFFYNGAWQQICPPDVVEQFMSQFDGGKNLIQYFGAPEVVKYVCESWLGIAGGILAILGVVAAPITSGDTAFRSARLIVADFLHVEQKQIYKRLMIGLPMFALATGLLVWQLKNPNGFHVLWQYFGWANQSLAALALWTATVYLSSLNRNYFVTLIPAVFMTMVTVTFLMQSNQAFGFSTSISYTVSTLVTLVALIQFIYSEKLKNNR